MRRRHPQMLLFLLVACAAAGASPAVGRLRDPPIHVFTKISIAALPGLNLRCASSVQG